jgi:hypothetical protein
MKKTVSLLLAVVLIVGSMLALTSCGKSLSGTYELDVVGGVTFEFSGKNVVLTVNNLFGDDVVVEGKYSIEENEDGKLEITFDFDENKDASKYEGTVSFAEGEENGKEYIKIGGIKYVKK